MRNFLGVFVLALGLRMLWDYTNMVAYMTGEATKMGFGETALAPVVDIAAQVVAYTWPVAAVLIGLAFLTKYYKHLAVKLFVLYMLLFAVSHVWGNNIQLAIWDVLLVVFVGVMNCCKGVGKLCEGK